MFNGEGPLSWVYKATHFFNFHNVPSHPPQHWLFITSFQLERKSIEWFQEMEEIGALTSWESFVKALQIQFGPSTYNNPIEALINSRGLSDAHKLSCFLRGL